MVTQELNNEEIYTIYLSSSDTKPTDCRNGQLCIEVDTGHAFRFDKENVQWVDFGTQLSQNL